MRFCLLIFPFVFFTTFLSAQIANISGIGNQVLKENKYVDIEGSPYLFTEWKPGTITDKYGKKFTDIFIKYDVYTDAIEVNQSGEIMVLNGELYPSFTIMFPKEGTNDVAVFNFSNVSLSDALTEKGYYEMLAEGEIKVVKKYKVKFVEENIASYGSTTNVKRFQATNTIYLITQSGVEIVKINNKSVLNALGEKQKVAEEYIKKERLKIKTEEDLLQLIDYLNQV